MDTPKRNVVWSRNIGFALVEEFPMVGPEDQKKQEAEKDAIFEFTRKCLYLGCSDPQQKPTCPNCPAPVFCGYHYEIVYPYK